MCEKFIEIYPGIIQCQPCSCKECLVKKQATKEFYKRFDVLYNQFQLDKKGAPNRTGAEMQGALMDRPSHSIRKLFIDYS